MNITIVPTLKDVLKQLDEKAQNRLIHKILNQASLDDCLTLLIQDDFFMKAYLVLPDLAITALDKIARGDTKLKGREVYALHHFVHLGYITINEDLYISQDLLERLAAVDEGLKTQRELSAYCLSMLEYVSLLYEDISIDALINVMADKVRINSHDLRILIKNVDPDEDYVHFEEDHYVSTISHESYLYNQSDDVNQSLFHDYRRYGFYASQPYLDFMNTYRQLSQRNDYYVRSVTHHVFRLLALGKDAQTIYKYVTRKCPDLDYETYHKLDRQMRRCL